MEENNIAAKNIRFEYADYVVPDPDREHCMVNNINNWLGQFAKEINGQEGKIVVYLQKENEQRVHFDGMTNDLEATLRQQMLRFRIPNNQRSDSPGM